jgi:hypothetical protein
MEAYGRAIKSSMNVSSYAVGHERGPVLPFSVYLDILLLIHEF